MLANVSNDLGFPTAAMSQARAGHVFAQEAGDPALTAWLYAQQSTFCYWNGQPGKAREYARRGAALNPGGTVGVWLPAVEARASGELGDVEGTRRARFGGDASFMWRRGQRPAEWTEHDGEETASPLELWPSEPVGNLAVGLHLPDCYTAIRPDPDGQTYHFVVWVMHPESGSWARAEVEPDRDTDYVYQGGSRRLWDEVEAAHAWWVGAGRPADTRSAMVLSHRSASSLACHSRGGPTSCTVDGRDSVPVTRAT